MTEESSGAISFTAHVALLRAFLSNRSGIVQCIEGLLNAQRKPDRYLQDRTLLGRSIEDCFYSQAGLSAEQVLLKGQLQAAHRASGFAPRRVSGLVNDLIDPGELTVRAFYLWQQTRWPGKNARMRYARTLFNLYLVRCLQLLSVRIWDEKSADPAECLRQLQQLLDDLWSDRPVDQPVFVRDARWLIPIAQSPTTDELAGYFDVAAKVAATMNDDDQVEIYRAHVRMLGGHLTSQIRHYCLSESIPLNDHSVILRTRMSNALDFALLIQELVPLIRTYKAAISKGETVERRMLAGAICQGVSPDPELMLNRTDLLGPYSMIEDVFIADGAVVAYSQLGERHIRLIEEYKTLIIGAAEDLLGDCSGFRPKPGKYSPYGAIFGTPTNLLEDIALKSLDRDAVTRFSVEDVLNDAGPGEAKLAWVNGWRKLPHISEEVQQLYDYPQLFAEEVFARVEQALEICVSAQAHSNSDRTGRMFIATEASAPDTGDVPELPSAFVGSSDRQAVADGRAAHYEQSKLLRDRREGYFIVSFETADGWVAISKDMLTETLGKGSDVRISGLSVRAAQVLRLMCPGLVA